MDQLVRFRKVIPETSTAFVVPSAGAAATFDPAKAGTDITLSNGNLTAASVAVFAWESVLSTTSKTSGKAYVEFHIDVLGGSGPTFMRFGFAESAGFDLNDTNGMGNNGNSGGASGQQGDGANGSGVVTGNSANLPVYVSAAGDIVAFAIDFDAGKAWLAHNNTFGGDPATGANPAWTWAAGGTWFFGVTVPYNQPIITVNPTSASQTYVPPAGFTSWS